MTCETFLKRLNQVCDRRLSPREDEDLQAHGFVCSHCQEILDLHDALWLGLQTGAVPPLKDDFTTSVMAELNPTPAEAAFSARSPRPGSLPLTAARPARRQGLRRRTAMWLTSATLLLVCFLLSWRPLVHPDSYHGGFEGSGFTSGRARGGTFPQVPPEQRHPTTSRQRLVGPKRFGRGRWRPRGPGSNSGAGVHADSKNDSQKLISLIAGRTDVKMVVVYLRERLVVWLSFPFTSADDVAGLKPLARSVSLTLELLQKALPRESDPSANPENSPRSVESSSAAVRLF